MQNSRYQKRKILNLRFKLSRVFKSVNILKSGLWAKKIFNSGFCLFKILNLAKILNSLFWLSKMLTSGFSRSKILNLGFWPFKIFKSAKILNPGFSPSKILSSGFRLQFKILAYKRLEVCQNLEFWLSQNLEFRFLVFENLQIRIFAS